jgi:hypothetical protein
VNASMAIGTVMSCTALCSPKFGSFEEPIGEYMMERPLLLMGMPSERIDQDRPIQGVCKRY